MFEDKYVLNVILGVWTIWAFNKSLLNVQMHYSSSLFPNWKLGNVIVILLDLIVIVLPSMSIEPLCNGLECLKCYKKPFKFEFLTFCCMNGHTKLAYVNIIGELCSFSHPRYIINII